jgi:hypothetical protein
VPRRSSYYDDANIGALNPESLVGFAFASSASMDGVDHSVELEEAQYKPIFLVRAQYGDVLQDDFAATAVWDTCWLGEDEYYTNFFDTDGELMAGETEEDFEHSVQSLRAQVQAFAQRFIARLQNRAEQHITAARDKRVACTAAPPAVAPAARRASPPRRAARSGAATGAGSSGARRDDEVTVEDLGADGASPASSTAASPDGSARARRASRGRGGAAARSAGGAAATSSVDAGRDARLFGEGASPSASAAGSAAAAAGAKRKRASAAVGRGRGCGRGRGGGGMAALMAACGDDSDDDDDGGGGITAQQAAAALTRAQYDAEERETFDE